MYIELVPNERIRHTDRFDDENLPCEMVVSIDFKAVSCGTELSILQEGIPSVIPVEMCYLGGSSHLSNLPGSLNQKFLTMADLSGINRVRVD